MPVYELREAVQDDEPTCSSCSTTDSQQHFQVSCNDIVGASLVNETGFSVWHAPISSQNANERRRRLLKTDVRICHSPRFAQQAVRLLRELNCWWSKGRPPCLAVFVNPVSGSGRSKSIWQRECLPILEAAGLELKFVETQRTQHAREHVGAMSLQNVDAIVCLGGDGTMSEIVQGLFARTDWETSVRIPICMIPGGTGNGMAASTGLWDATTAVHALCKGALRRMDIVSVCQPPARRYFSFLSLTFGFIANVDIGTENLRWMGSLRNQVGAILEILKTGSYAANFAFVPAGGTGLDSASPGGIGTPLLDQLGPLEDFQSLSSATLPEGWELAESAAFSLFAVSIMPYLALDFTLVPTEQVDSGEMTLTHLPGHLGRWEALQVMLKADAGKLAEVKKLSLAKIKAFVLEPLCTGTWLVMDGEVLPYERIFAEIHPGICNLIVAP